jgi:hypothetical protein
MKKYSLGLEFVQKHNRVIFYADSENGIENIIGFLQMAQKL